MDLHKAVTKPSKMFARLCKFGPPPKKKIKDQMVIRKFSIG